MLGKHCQFTDEIKCRMLGKHCQFWVYRWNQEQNVGQALSVSDEIKSRMLGKHCQFTDEIKSRMLREKGAPWSQDPKVHQDAGATSRTVTGRFGPWAVALMAAGPVADCSWKEENSITLENSNNVGHKFWF